VQNFGKGNYSEFMRNKALSHRIFGFPSKFAIGRGGSSDDAPAPANGALCPSFRGGFRSPFGSVGRSGRTALGCALALFALANPATRADIVASNTAGTFSDPTSIYIGQSFTTAAGAKETNITFNFFSNSPATTASANGVGFLLSAPYTGTPNNLSSSTPGFLGQANASGGVFTFSPNVVLAPGTVYYFYENAPTPVNGVTGGNVIVGGQGYISSLPAPGGPFAAAAESFNFLVMGLSSLQTAYWDGRTDGNWTHANWALNAADTQTILTPSAATDVTFSITSGARNENTTLGADFTIHSLTINDPAAVTIGGSNTLTISGASGTGINVMSGSGLLTINANLTLAGASNTITVNNVAGAVINGVVGGTIGLVKQGAGVLTLNGADTYTGPTMVNMGALIVNGSIASAVTVRPGALIGGSGVIGGNLVNYGLVSPGDAPGALTVNGNFSQSAGGTLLLRVGGLAAAQHDLLSVVGSASLAGTLQLEQLNGFQLHAGQKLTILTASGGVSGAFSTVASPYPNGTLLGVGVIYLSNSAMLEGVQTPFLSIPHETPNQQAVAAALDASFLDPRNTGLITHLDNESISKVLNDLNLLAPSELTSIYQIAISQAKIQTANLQRRLEDVRAGSNGFSAAGFAMNGSSPGYSGPLGDGGLLQARGPDGKDDKSGKMALAPAPDNRWGVFVTGTGEWAEVGDTSNARGYDLTNAGFTLGVDYKVTDHFVIGLATGYDHSSADLSNNGRVIVDGGKLALYSSYFTGKGFYTDLSVEGGYNGYETHRAAVEGLASGNDDGGELNLLFGTGYDWKIGGLTFGPTGTFEYTYLGINSFGERGSLAPLDFPSQHQESIRSAFGAKASCDWKIGSVVVRPELRAAWQHEYGDATLGIDSSLGNGAGPEFLVHGPATGRDSLLLSTGFAIQCSARCSTYVYYDGELARANYHASSISGGFRFDF
jgi:autotransporter-associated beta strand protein